MHCLELFRVFGPHAALSVTKILMDLRMDEVPKRIRKETVLILEHAMKKRDGDGSRRHRSISSQSGNEHESEIFATDVGLPWKFDQ